MFAKVSDQLNAYDKTIQIKLKWNYEGTEVPNGPTPRLKALKANFLKQVPSISIERAKIVTEYTKIILVCLRRFCVQNVLENVVKLLH